MARKTRVKSNDKGTNGVSNGAHKTPVPLTDIEQTEFRLLTERRDALRNALADHTLAGKQLIAQWEQLTVLINDRLATYATMHGVSMGPEDKVRFDLGTLQFEFDSES